MTSHLNIYRLLIIASLALNLWIPLIIEAADRLPGSGIPEIMDGPISSHPNPPATTAVAPAQTTGVDDIANALGSYLDRKSTRLNSSHRTISYAVFCLK